MSRRNVLIIFLTCLVVGNMLLFTESAKAKRNYTAQELKQVIDSGEPLFLLNPLSEIEFNEAHIPGSINIPAEEVMKTKKLPEDKNTLIVTYCKGPK